VPAPCTILPLELVPLPFALLILLYSCSKFATYIAFKLASERDAPRAIAGVKVSLLLTLGLLNTMISVHTTKLNRMVL